MDWYWIVLIVGFSMGIGIVGFMIWFGSGWEKGR